MHRMPKELAGANLRMELMEFAQVVALGFEAHNTTALGDGTANPGIDFISSGWNSFLRFLKMEGVLKMNYNSLKKMIGARCGELAGRVGN
jgi:hypothetical protein